MRKLLCMVGMLLGIASAQSISTLQRQLQQNQQIQNIQNQQVKSIQFDLQVLEQQEKEIQAKVSAYQGRIAQIQKEIRKTREQIQFKSAEINSLSSQIAQNTERSNALKQKVKSQMVLLYRDKSNRYIKMLARAENIYDLAIKNHYFNALGKQDLTVVNELKRVAKKLETDKKQMDQAMAQLQSLQKGLYAKNESMQKEKDLNQQELAKLQVVQKSKNVLLNQTARAAVQTQQTITTIVNRIAVEQSRLAEIERRKRQAEAARQAQLARQRYLAEQARITAERKRLVAERERLEKLRQQEQRQAQIKAEEASLARQQQQNTQAQQAQQAQSTPVASDNLPENVSLAFPMGGGKVSSAFGKNGNVFTLIAGSSDVSGVTASAAGQVLDVSYYQALGWLVMIKHTAKLVTVYSGLQKPVIEKYSNVTKGQLLGYTGGAASLPSNQFQYWVGVLQPSGDPNWIAPGF